MNHDDIPAPVGVKITVNGDRARSKRTSKIPDGAGRWSGFNAVRRPQVDRLGALVARNAFDAIAFKVLAVGHLLRHCLIRQEGLEPGYERYVGESPARPVVTVVARFFAVGTITQLRVSAYVTDA